MDGAAREAVEALFREAELGAKADVAAARLGTSAEMDAAAAADAARRRQLVREASDRYAAACSLLFRVVPEYEEAGDEDALRVLHDVAEFLMDRMAALVGAAAAKQSSSGLVATHPPTTTTTTMTGDDEKRLKVAKELLETEERYAAKLQMLVDHYAKPLRATMDVADYDVVFGGLMEIAGLAQTLVGSLRPKLEAWDPAETTVGDCILRLSEFFKMYVPYTSNFAAGQKVLERLKDGDEDFSRVCEVAVAGRGAPPLESLRIEPVQRIPRYVLLLKELEKATKETHPDAALVRGALQALKVVADHINQRMADKEMQAKVLEIQSSLWSATETVPNLVEPGRRFVKEGPVGKLRRDGKVQRNYYLFAFSDVVVYATVSPVLRGRYHFHRMLPFYGAFAADEEVAAAGGPGLKFGEAAFKITGPSGYRIFVVETDAVRREWLGVFMGLVGGRSSSATVAAGDADNRRRSLGSGSRRASSSSGRWAEDDVDE